MDASNLTGLIVAIISAAVSLLSIGISAWSLIGVGDMMMPRRKLMQRMRKCLTNHSTLLSTIYTII